MQLWLLLSSFLGGPQIHRPNKRAIRLLVGR